MKLLSFFSIRRPQQGPRQVRAGEMRDWAERAARLLGVPQHQLTAEVRAALNALMGEVATLRGDIEVLKSKLAEAEAAADYDPLAPVYNRRAFMREASRISAMVRRHEIEASLIYFDLNGFKEVNDLHGHPAGDAILRAVAEVLVRQTRETDIVGRIGGDEFAVVLSMVGEEAARHKAETLAAAIRTERVLFDGVPLQVSTAFGVASFSAFEGPEQLLARADEAMYADKALHRRARA